MPRANGRIDLAEGVSAHLLVAASGEAMGFCTVTPTLELSLNREDTSLVPTGSRGPQPKDIAQSLEVPFGGRDCVSIDVSAWRQGSFDGDLLNSHQADLAHASESISEPAVPAECNKAKLPPGYVEPLVCTATVSCCLPSLTCIVSPIDFFSACASRTPRFYVQHAKHWLPPSNISGRLDTQTVGPNSTFS